ncbi:hypothetical protein GMJAKD_10120 [Candidatus Electrothrix aarhusensis]
MPQKIAVFFFVLLDIICSGPLKAAPLVEIIDIKWCSSIATSEDLEKNKEPVGLHENGSIFSGPKLYLWMKVKGGQKALDQLRQGRRVDIIQRWKYQYYGAQTDPIDVSIEGKKLNEDIISKLQQEINQRGYFDWRTWGTKDNLKAAEYNVDVVNAFYSPLDCARLLSCAMNIRLR